jgi:tetratricopeptide (TPR) repeat protein
LQAKDIFAGGQNFVKSDYLKAISEFENSRDLFEQLGDAAEAGIAENWAAQLLPDVGKIAESRKRLSAIIATAESRKFKILIPAAYYWLGVSDYRQTGLSETNKNYKTALRLAEAGSNAFEIQHTQEALASYYSALGELEPALAHASMMLPGQDLYYQSASQSWREKGTLAELTLKLKFFATSLSFSKEALDIAREKWPASSLVNSNLRNVANAAVAKKDFEAALKYADESKRLALNRGDTAENMQPAAETYLLLAEVKSRMKDCNEALTDYDKALELYSHLPEFTMSLYQIHKGKLFCFQQLDRREDFSVELKTVLRLSEEYRAKIREDASRQAFFANEQFVFDAAIANAMKELDSPGAFAFVEASRARSLLDFVKSD